MVTNIYTAFVTSRRCKQMEVGGACSCIVLLLCIWYLRSVLLTLGAHAPEGYGSCPVCVSVCVCVSVLNLNLGTGASRGLNEGTSE